ncbi:unnamed protein product [Lota lota]
MGEDSGTDDSRPSSNCKLGHCGLCDSFEQNKKLNGRVWKYVSSGPLNTGPLGNGGWRLPDTFTMTLRFLRMSLDRKLLEFMEVNELSAVKKSPSEYFPEETSPEQAEPPEAWSTGARKQADRRGRIQPHLIGNGHCGQGPDKHGNYADGIRPRWQCTGQPVPRQPVGHAVGCAAKWRAPRETHALTTAIPATPKVPADRPRIPQRHGEVRLSRGWKVEKKPQKKPFEIIGKSLSPRLLR